MSDHFVYFYEDEMTLVNQVTGFIRAGLVQAGDCIDTGLSIIQLSWPVAIGGGGDSIS